MTDQATDNECCPVGSTNLAAMASAAGCCCAARLGGGRRRARIQATTWNEHREEACQRQQSEGSRDGVERPEPSAGLGRAPHGLRHPDVSTGHDRVVRFAGVRPGPSGRRAECRAAAQSDSRGTDVGPSDRDERSAGRDGQRGDGEDQPGAPEAASVSPTHEVMISRRRQGMTREGHGGDSGRPV